jgi:cellulose synthase/poly-beta-1,6-N-acetylglucosamine synthase-like glycosyltransferase
MISIVVISKDEPALDATLTSLRTQVGASTEPAEVLVVDASDRRLDAIREAHTRVRWIDFTVPVGVRVSIPHQRNSGVASAAGDIIVFTDAGCLPRGDWLNQLTAPLRSGRDTVAAGVTAATDGHEGYEGTRAKRMVSPGYLRECGTGNMAFRRTSFDDVGGFDERFEYGSDVDFSWRLVDAGHRIRFVPEVVVVHDWGTRRRQLRRAYLYGRARARLYRRHPNRIPRIVSDDPVVVFYPLFLLGLPIAVRYRWYLALLLLAAWRNRANAPLRAVASNLVYGLGVLRELVWR